MKPSANFVVFFPAHWPYYLSEMPLFLADDRGDTVASTLQVSDAQRFTLEAGKAQVESLLVRSPKWWPALSY